MRTKTKESLRLNDRGSGPVPPWKKWGPYVAERSWGTVREDYSEDGNAWAYFPFEDSHKRAYRWEEDGIAGFCDRYQILCLTWAFWNEKDPILKERLFGLTCLEGNHGEDVKEFYYYLDALPTHTYMKYLYKCPQKAFPYEQLKQENRNRSANDPEFELVDTHIFDEDAYFDIFIEYAKASYDDICIKVEIINRGNNQAPFHILPQLIFRNQWSWGEEGQKEPRITNASDKDFLCLLANDSELLSPKKLNFDYHLGDRFLYGSREGEPLFTNNNTAGEGVHYAKDGFHRKIIKKENVTNPGEIGTKGCLHYQFENIAPQESKILYFRFTNQKISNPLEGVEAVIQKRKKEADEFYNSIHPKLASDEEKMIQRQAFAGMIWNKQFYHFDVSQWFKGDPLKAPPESRKNIRNVHWDHLNSMRVLSMPDKWEFPWFAAWDLAFHCLTFGLIDITFAKEQLWLLLFDQFQHPNGGIPACEWEFSDLNPPVQAWAAIQLYFMEKEQTGKRDLNFLKQCFLKLIMNFSYWVNKVDSSGCNVFEGGFLGLDNITLIDRSLKTEGAIVKQSDGTGWMAMFCLNLMRIALELATEDPTYEGLATKFFQHFCYIAYAIKKQANNLWSEEDEFFYDRMILSDGTSLPFKVRSLVGIIPLYAVDILKQEELDRFPDFKKNFDWFLENRKSFTADCAIWIPEKKIYLLSLVDRSHLESVLKYAWDPNEFRSPFGLRSLSKYHEKNPFHFRDLHIYYEPGESQVIIKGGNSNWRGPIWFPMSYLFIEVLRKYHLAFEDLKLQNEKEEPADLNQASLYFSELLISIFKKNQEGIRPVFGLGNPLAKNPHFSEFLLFHEYFHADSGKGLGASHQTGWTGLVANLIHEKFKNTKGSFSGFIGTK